MSMNSRSCMLGLLASLLAGAPLWAQNSMTISGCPTQIGAGKTVTCSLNLVLGAGQQIDGLTFNLSATSNGGAPAATGGAFIPATGITYVSNFSSGAQIGGTGLDRKSTRLNSS